MESGVFTTYDGDGRRASKTAGEATTYFLYDGDVPVCELSSSGTVTATNTVGANGVISRHTSAGSVFYAFDPSGDAAQRLDPNKLSFKLDHITDPQGRRVDYVIDSGGAVDATQSDDVFDSQGNLVESLETSYQVEADSYTGDGSYYVGASRQLLH